MKFSLPILWYCTDLVTGNAYQMKHMLVWCHKHISKKLKWTPPPPPPIPYPQTTHKHLFQLFVQCIHFHITCQVLKKHINIYEYGFTIEKKCKRRCPSTFWKCFMNICMQRVRVPVTGFFAEMHEGIITGIFFLINLSIYQR